MATTRQSGLFLGLSVNALLRAMDLPPEGHR
jgi:hypothetical protein